MREPTVQTGFVSTDGGLSLYWKATGEGPRTLICCNGVGVSTFFWKFVVEHFASGDPGQGHRVVLWDYRGHGLSDRPHHPDAVDLSIQACARDLGRIQDAVGAERAVLLGHSMGCQVVFERALQAPDRVAGLVPMLGSAGRVLDTFYNTPNSARVFRLIYAMTELAGDRANRFTRSFTRSSLIWPFVKRLRLVDPLYASREDFIPYADHLSELDLRLFLRMVRQAHLHDAFPRLQEIDSPTLIIAAERDDFTPLWISRRMRDLLPFSDMLVLADATHTGIIEQPRTINHRLERFLREEVSWPATPRGA